MSSPDPIRLQHALEQFGAALHSFPPVLRAYYDDCKRAGFTPGQAFQLVRDLQQALLTLADVDRSEGGSVE